MVGVTAQFCVMGSSVPATTIVAGESPIGSHQGGNITIRRLLSLSVLALACVGWLHSMFVLPRATVPYAPADFGFAMLFEPSLSSLHLSGSSSSWSTPGMKFLYSGSLFSVQSTKGRPYHTPPTYTSGAAWQTRIPKCRNLDIISILVSASYRWRPSREGVTPQ